jgi:hypothetical protein
LPLAGWLIHVAQSGHAPAATTNPNVILHPVTLGFSNQASHLVGAIGKAKCDIYTGFRVADEPGHEALPIRTLFFATMPHPKPALSLAMVHGDDGCRLSCAVKQIEMFQYQSDPRFGGGLIRADSEMKPETLLSVMRIWGKENFRLVAVFVYLYGTGIACGDSGRYF